jgi:hypothetical protein
MMLPPGTKRTLLSTNVRSGADHRSEEARSHETGQILDDYANRVKKFEISINIL